MKRKYYLIASRRVREEFRKRFVEKKEFFLKRSVMPLRALRRTKWGIELPSGEKKRKLFSRETS
jgi:hypothetical protein